MAAKSVVYTAFVVRATVARHFCWQHRFRPRAPKRAAIRRTPTGTRANLRRYFPLKTRPIRSRPPFSTPAHRSPGFYHVRRKESEYSSPLALYGGARPAPPPSLTFSHFSYITVTFNTNGLVWNFGVLTPRLFVRGSISSSWCVFDQFFDDFNRNRCQFSAGYGFSAAGSRLTS